MAKRNNNPEAAALFEAERADREENADVNEAIARTDSEVFTDAMGEEPLDDEAGTELEEMGDGLEGEELDEEEAEPEVEAAAEEGEEVPEGEEEPEGEVEEAHAPQERPQPSIPPRVLRETRERARETENELRAQLRDMQMRIDNLSRQPPPQAPPPQPAQPAIPMPDMFAEPDRHTEWQLAETERRVQALLDQRFAQMQQQQQQREMERLDESLKVTASGPRAYEFNIAHHDLTSLDKTPENSRLVQRLVSQPDPGQAILDWWEKSSNPEYVEYHRNQIRQIYAPQQPAPRQGPIGRQLQQNGYRQPVRHEVRLPRSLSEASGGRSQHISDAEMSDGSEESVFAYGARR